MAVKRSSRPNDVGLSMDSLIDVFMNVIGVLMITAVVLALTVNEQSDATKSEPALTPKTPPPRQNLPPPPEPVRLTLPQAMEASTKPLYVFVNREGIRAVNGNDPNVRARFFSIDYNPITESLILNAIPGSVMGSDDLRRWLRAHGPSTHHLTAIINPDGAGFYKELRQLVSQEGFRSGWVPHEGATIILGSGGRSGNTVQ